MMLYQFSNGLRKPTVRIAASNVEAAVAKLVEITGRSKLISAIQKIVQEYDPVLHGTKDVVFAEPTEAIFFGSDQFPLLSMIGVKGIRPEWVLDRKTGKVRLSGEFEDFPEYLLDKSGKPTVDDLRHHGGRIGGALDVWARELMDYAPWLHVEDGEDLRQRILDELNFFERARDGQMYCR